MLNMMDGFENGNEGSDFRNAFTRFKRINRYILIETTALRHHSKPNEPFEIIAKHPSGFSL